MTLTNEILTRLLTDCQDPLGNERRWQFRSVYLLINLLACDSNFLCQIVSFSADNGSEFTGSEPPGREVLRKFLSKLRRIQIIR